MPRFAPQSFNSHHFHTRLGIGVVAAIALLLAILILKLLLPWLILLTLLWVGHYLWQRHRNFEKRLYDCFYECLKAQQGRISALDFAMKAQITGPQARSFLDARAKDFFGDFEPTNYGDVLYTFRRSGHVAENQLPKLHDGRSPLI